MKTETKTIKCWANYYPERLEKTSVFIYNNESDAAFVSKAFKPEPSFTIPCTITLELPVEEKKVTISESELAEAWDKMSHHTCYALSKESVAFDIFKQNIFGGG